MLLAALQLHWTVPQAPGAQSTPCFSTCPQPHSPVHTLLEPSPCRDASRPSPEPDERDSEASEYCDACTVDSGRLGMTAGLWPSESDGCRSENREVAVSPSAHGPCSPWLGDVRDENCDGMGSSWDNWSRVGLARCDAGSGNVCGALLAAAPARLRAV